MRFAQAQSRPIPGAVATIGVSDRVAFLRRTYGLLGLSLVGFAALAGGMMRFATETSLAWSSWAMRGQWTWLAVMVLFMIVGVVAQKLAQSPTSRAVQLTGLGIFVIAEAILLQPLLWVVMIRFGNHALLAHGATGMNTEALTIIMEAVIITLAIFVGLTLTVFITKKDFSFLRGILMIASFALLGIILVSAIFGFHLGVLFLGFGIVILGGYILMQTSLVMSQFPPTAYVAAALMLFSTVATLFWYVLQLVMEMNSSRR